MCKPLFISVPVSDTDDSAKSAFSENRTQVLGGVELEYYGGDGYDGVGEDGVFEVKTRKKKIFKSLSKARRYYDKLNEEKFLWDVTSGLELLEGHTIKG